MNNEIYKLARLLMRHCFHKFNRFIKLMRMKKDLKIELEVSPWEVFNDNIHEQYTITKKIRCFSPQNKGKVKPVVKEVRSPHEKIKQLLMVFEKPKESIKQQFQLTRKQDNISIFKKIKLNAGVLKQEREQGDESRQNEKIKILKSEKEIVSQKQTPKQSSWNSRHELFSNLRRKHKRIVERLENCEKQIIFMRKEMHPIKSNEKLKSNKELILPKIRLCTIS